MNNWNQLTDEDRQRAFESQPDMLEGFLKKWGWLHFAKAIEEECHRKNEVVSVGWQVRFRLQYENNTFGSWSSWWDIPSENVGSYEVRRASKPDRYEMREIFAKVKP